jgi:hypothetical protein
MPVDEVDRQRARANEGSAGAVVGVDGVAVDIRPVNRLFRIEGVVVGATVPGS